MASPGGVFQLDSHSDRASERALAERIHVNASHQEVDRSKVNRLRGSTSLNTARRYAARERPTGIFASLNNDWPSSISPVVRKKGCWSAIFLFSFFSFVRSLYIDRQAHRPDTQWPCTTVIAEVIAKKEKKTINKGHE